MNTSRRPAFAAIVSITMVMGIPALATDDFTPGLRGITTRDTDVYAAPDPESTRVGSLRPSVIVKALEMKKSVRKEWVRVEPYDTDRAAGWVRRDHVRSISREGFWWEVQPVATPAEALAPPASPPSPCTMAKRDLEDLFHIYDLFPRGCKAASDCAGYYYRVSSCDRAVVMKKQDLKTAAERELLKRQQAARTICEPDPVACSPAPFEAACVQGVCSDKSP